MREQVTAINWLLLRECTVNVTMTMSHTHTQSPEELAKTGKGRTLSELKKDDE